MYLRQYLELHKVFICKMTGLSIILREHKYLYWELNKISVSLCSIVANSFQHRRICHKYIFMILFGIYANNQKEIHCNIIGLHFISNSPIHLAEMWSKIGAISMLIYPSHCLCSLIFICVSLEDLASLYLSVNWS